MLGRAKLDGEGMGSGDWVGRVGRNLNQRGIGRGGVMNEMKRERDGHAIGLKFDAGGEADGLGEGLGELGLEQLEDRGERKHRGDWDEGRLVNHAQTAESINEELHGDRGEQQSHESCG